MPYETSDPRLILPDLICISLPTKRVIHAAYKADMFHPNLKLTPAFETEWKIHDPWLSAPMKAQGDSFPQWQPYVNGITSGYNLLRVSIVKLSVPLAAGLSHVHATWPGSPQHCCESTLAKSGVQASRGDRRPRGAVL